MNKMIFTGKHCMLDLETMSARVDASIIAIGATMFSFEHGLASEVFYTRVALSSSMEAGGHVSASTIDWWMQQSEEARGLFKEPAVNLPQALMDLRAWLGWQSGGDARNLNLWGNGAAFDNVILRGAYERLNLPLPWEFYNDRCYRTMKALCPDVKLVRVGTHHSALDDALSQAGHLVDIYHHINGTKVRPWPVDDADDIPF